MNENREESKKEINKNENDKENKNSFQKKWIILFLAIIFLILLIFGCSENSNQSKENHLNNEIRSDQEFSDSGEDLEQELTPEQVIAQLEKAEGIGVKQGPIAVEIISPEEEIFSPSQAKHYRAEIEGLKTGSSCSCDWKFYLNENIEEALYKEMTDRPCTTVNEGLEDEQLYVCGFTSTFIDKVGELRVEVAVEVEKQNEIVETVKTEKTYMIE